MISMLYCGKAVVKCDGCGEVIDFGGWQPYDRMDCGNTVGIYVHDDEHYCDRCAEEVDGRCEFRICDVCGKPMFMGFTNEGNGLGADFHACEECFEQAISDRFGDWRKKDYEGDCGGYYDAYDPRECEWYDTGIFWTQWD